MPEKLIDRDKARERRESYLTSHPVKIARSVEELLGPDTGESEEEIRKEVDDFLSLLEEWRSQDDSVRDLD